MPPKTTMKNFLLGVSSLFAIVTVTRAVEACSDDSSVYCNTWIMNAGNEYSSAPFLDNVLTDVEMIEIDGDYLHVVASGIPKYTTVITEEIYNALTSRPKADTDFRTGAPIVAVGDQVEWGANIGYVGRQGCAAGSSGYWPTGPSCPSDQNLNAYFPMQPEATNDVCYQPLGNLGLFANGVAVYGMLDGTSYNSEGIWNCLAAKFEVYDIDINNGHAQTSGQYHMHAMTDMIATLKGENNSDAKSSVWGIAADGYPIVGPYVDDGVEAQSCWKARDYSDESLGGCGTAGARTCVLVDRFDLSKGTTTATHSGPNVGGTTTTQSGNTITTESGIFYEDYYYDPDCTSQGDEYLDRHNGRTDADLGYVYHMTNSFPYNIGPTFKGTLHANGLVSTCHSTSTPWSPSTTPATTPRPTPFPTPFPTPGGGTTPSGAARSRSYIAAALTLAWLIYF